MSILGYSSSYFLPEYWAGTPLYGEKIIPLLDYILSTDFIDSDKIAGAFYNIANKYKNTADLPIEQIKALIEESGYDYILGLLGEDEDSIRLLTYILVLVHQLKGSEKGLKLVLSLLRKGGDPLVMKVIGKPTILPNNDVYDFSESNYITYSGFTTDTDPFELNFLVRTSALGEEQCIASTNAYGFYLGITSNGKLVLSLGSNRTSWDIVERELSLNTLLPNTNYYVNLIFDGVSYNVVVSQDNKKFSNYIEFSSNKTTKIHEGTIYLGINNAEGSYTDPFKGFINIGSFATDIDSITMEEWWETEEVGEEDTFSVKADLDIGLLGTGFFKNFASFAKKYVYPSLRAFEARTTLKNKITIASYVRETVEYTVKVNLLTFSAFMSKVADNVEEWEDFYSVNIDGDSPEFSLFNVLETNSDN